MKKQNTTKTEIQKLTKTEQEELAKHVEAIKKSKSDESANFQQLAAAFHQIQAKKLFRDHYPTEAAFFEAEFGYSRSHSLRLASEGRLLDRLSPMGDNAVKLFASDRHLRPLLKFKADEQDAAIKVAQSWMTWAGVSELSPKLLEAVVTYLHPPAAPTGEKESVATTLAAKFHEAVAKSKTELQNKKPELPGPVAKVVFKELDILAKKALALGGPRRSTGIDWTDSTWNPLQGCTRASAGCDHCYAAKCVATRLAGRYPGLAKETVRGGKKTYAFTGKIKLLPHQLAVPLQDKTPKRYFVNSMSDLFHKNVSDEFIDAVFTVMENATWHQFQVLTKRPERMAEFSQKRYKDKEPAANIWLGTSTETQQMFDLRYPHLIKVKAAILWLSIEPLLGPIKVGNLAHVDWVIVGGESGSDRRMEKPWATSLRNQCSKAKVAFFFKQWGAFDEKGNKARKPKKDGLTPATLDGVVHDAYPEPRVKKAMAAKPEKSSALSGSKKKHSKSANGHRTVRTGLRRNCSKEVIPA
jgi:protein gp37